MHASKKLVLVAASGWLMVGCTGEISSTPNTEDSPELVGAGGRELLADWLSIDIPFSNNTKMLNFHQLQNEVRRATTRSWVDRGVDQWALNRAILGGADFQDVWQFDITPNQQKILTIRRMAFAVCGDLVTAESGQSTPTVFATLDPGAPIVPAAEATATQVSQLYRRMFLEAPSQAEVDASVALLAGIQAAKGQREAWRGLCAAYLASMRFLSY